jgi:hypothetical protein
MFSWYCKNEKCPSAESCSRNQLHYPRMVYADLIDVELDGKDKCPDYEAKDDSI